MRARAVSVADRARRARFERLVEHALNGLPRSIRARLNNLDIVIEDEPSSRHLDVTDIADGDLFGLYEGVPLTERGTDYSMVLPDRIVIFRGPLERAFLDRTSIEEQIRITVYHELAHHLGFDEDDIDKLGLA
jgi:predicted Zn-dependent protease with MMP-like domain